MDYGAGPRTRAVVRPVRVENGDEAIRAQAAWEGHVAAGRIGEQGTGAAPAERGLASLERLVGRG